MNCNNSNNRKILYVFGELSNPEKEALELHLSSCTKCSDEVRKLKETFEAVRRLNIENPSDRCIAKIRALPFDKTKTRLRWKNVPALTVGFAALILVFSNIMLKMAKTPEFPYMETQLEAVEDLVLADEGEIVFSFHTYTTMEDEFSIIESKLLEAEEEMEKVTGGGQDEESLSGGSNGVFVRRICVHGSGERTLSRV